MKKIELIRDNNGHQAWFLAGKCHREDGPAIILFTGHKQWWINDKFIKAE